MVGKYVAAGMPRTDAGFDLEECRAWVADNFPKTGHGGKRGPKTDPADPTIRDLQARRLSAAAQLDELELSKKSREVLDAKTTLQAVRAHAQQVRQLFDRLPLAAAKRIVARLDLKGDALPVVRDELQAELVKVYQALASQPLPEALTGG